MCCWTHSIQTFTQWVCVSTDLAPFCAVTSTSIRHLVCKNLSLQHVESLYWSGILCASKPCRRVCLQCMFVHAVLLELTWNFVLTRVIILGGMLLISEGRKLSIHLLNRFLSVFNVKLAIAFSQSCWKNEGLHQLNMAVALFVFLSHFPACLPSHWLSSPKLCISSPF